MVHAWHSRGHGENMNFLIVLTSFLVLVASWAEGASSNSHYSIYTDYFSYEPDTNKSNSVQEVIAESHIRIGLSASKVFSEKASGTVDIKVGVSSEAKSLAFSTILKFKNKKKLKAISVNWLSFSGKGTVSGTVSSSAPVISYSNLSDFKLKLLEVDFQTLSDSFKWGPSHNLSGWRFFKYKLPAVVQVRAFYDQNESEVNSIFEPGMNALGVLYFISGELGGKAVNQASSIEHNGWNLFYELAIGFSFNQLSSDFDSNVLSSTEKISKTKKINRR